MFKKIVKIKFIRKCKMNYGEKENTIHKKGIYKTEQCKFWGEYEWCPFGKKCHFAHGQHEIKKRKRPDGYKTKSCISFIRTGKCRFGHRCNFKHQIENDLETRVLPPSKRTKTRFNFERMKFFCKI